MKHIESQNHTESIQLEARARATSLSDLGACELLAQIEKKQTTVTEIAEAFEKRVERYNDQVQCWDYFDSAVIREQIAQLDSKVTGKLYGIPVGIKDVFNTQSMPTEMGSPLWSGFTPGNDARVVHYLRQERAILFGKTATAEFAVHAQTKTRNPHGLAHSPGTSSGGSATAVATRMVPIALGTQSGGSIIRPASYCGVFGYKPTFGVVPRTGVLKTADTLDTIGWFAHRSEDLALLFDLLRVKGRDYPIIEQKLNHPNNQATPQRWKLGYVQGPKTTQFTPYAKQALDEFLKNLEKDPQFEVTECKLPESFDQAHAVHTTLYHRSLAYYFKQEQTQPDQLSPVLRTLIEEGNSIDLKTYQQALNKQTDLTQEWENLLKNRFDIIIDLSTAGEAPKLKQNQLDPEDHCLIYTLCGAPTVNVPQGKGPNHLPLGIQLISRKYTDYRLLTFLQLLKTKNLITPNPTPLIT